MVNGSILRILVDSFQCFKGLSPPSRVPPTLCDAFYTNGLFRGSDSSGSDSSRDDLARALRKLTSLPLEDGNGEGLKQISELVLLGESESDRRLHDVLREVLAEHFGSLVTTANGERPRIIDPLFAASRGVAYDCWDRMNFKEHNEEL